MVVLALAAPGAQAQAAPAPQAQAQAQVVVDGHARFEVLTPTLIRLEYAGDDRFQDAATFTVPSRNLPAASFTTDVAGGYREIRTASLTLRYREGSGPFTSANTSVQVGSVTATPEFPSYCVFGTPCQAENGLMTGSASPAYDHANYTGSGFQAGFQSTGSTLAQDVSGIPAAGTYQLSVRYANATGGDGQNTTRTLSTTVDGAPGPKLTLPPTGSWDTWSTVSAQVALPAGTHTVALAQTAADSGNVNVDSFAVTATGAGYPSFTDPLLTTAYGAGPKNVLGGWDRSLDNPGTLPVAEHPGILDRDGWYLLDDSRTALLNANHTVTDRPAHGGQPYQDGYFFGYGQDYKQGLADLNTVTGGTDLLPQSAYGVWYSRYYAYSTADYENTLLPAFRNTFTPLDWLVIDTDWKSPSQWNGWNWNSALFPDPQSFLNWTQQQGLSTALNIHTSIAGNDPQFAKANATAGGLIPESGNNQYDFDWSDPAHLKAYFDLHQPFEQQGVREWWLDYCTTCGGSLTSDPHVAPDNFINQAYADDGTARGVRGFSFARLGGDERGGIESNFALGPWSERRNTMQFTGDTPATWDMLAFEARFTPDEAAAGLSNVSHDIGSFHGGHLADDLYARWVQLGTFQPVDRLHSDHGDRLPWNYTGAAAAGAERFLRLREALVPYTYTLAQQANATGVPITRPLYLDYPAQNDAYTHPQEYLYGDNVLVAPITTPNDSAGNGSVTAWIPPGTWTDYFSGTTYTGPSTATITDPLTAMPVLIKAGGIMPTRTNYVDNQQSPLTQVTLNVAAGADGTFTLYQDAGEGPLGQSASTPISWQDGNRTLTIGATTGSYPGAVTARTYTLRLSAAAAPAAVLVDGTQVPETAWSYNGDKRTVTVTTASLPVTGSHTVTLAGSGSGNPSAGEVLGANGQCLTANPSVALAPCDHSAAQLVTPPSGGAVRISGQCLDQAKLAACTGSATQSWTLRSNGELVNAGTGQCLAASGMAACTGTADQVWRFPPAQVSGPGGLCTDIADADPASGTAVQLYTCNQSDAQRWSAPGDQTLRALGKCLDVTLGGTANGTPVQLWDCNGTGSQVWVTRADGSLQNPASGRCLDDPQNARKPGDRLQLYDCNGSAAQRFRLGS
ncbi:alpha-xylosidase [Amycolatopsis bartoniae]|uniref:Alpha-xylosidase n=1 Tax=Amycolatopsis bartoniae TaxID=941986 RepID=A0A8H9MC83_9PSEU|nr:alpha-xylosidase [Amycolatopsis bartoniae]